MHPSQRIWLSGTLDPEEWGVRREVPGEEVVAVGPPQVEVVEAQDPAAQTQSAQVSNSSSLCYSRG